MSETTTSPSTANVTQAAKPSVETRVVLASDPDVDILMDQFDGQSKGFERGMKFAKPVAKTLEGAIRICTAEVEPVDPANPKDAERYKAEVKDAREKAFATVIAFVNQAINLRLTNKIKNSKIPANVTDEVAAKQLADISAADPSGRGLIFTVEEAKTWHPGQREPGKAEIMDEIFAELKSGEFDQAEIIKKLMMAGRKQRK